MLQRPRGTRDFLPEEMERRRRMETTMKETARLRGYQEVATPVFEDLELFTLRSGEGIIQEMYIFQDKGGRDLTLRPELTAPVLRMYVNEGRIIPKPIRWCYFSNCFRYERPQKGRYREFWQFGVELIGADSPLADVEVIAVADEVLRSCGVQFEMKVGHLAPMKYLLATLASSTQKVVMGYMDKRDMAGLEEYLEGIGERELLENLLSLVTCKHLDDLFAITGPIPEKERIERTFALLEMEGVSCAMNFGIARGLDYYTGMVFEGFAENLGAENQVVGGGAYRLAHLFGGGDVGSTGFAIGFDRVMVSIGEFPLKPRVRVGIACTEESRPYATMVAHAFRKESLPTTIDLMERGLGAQLAHLARDVEYAVILGRREMASRTVSLKHLQSGVQKELSLQDAISEVKGSGDR
jgi:histidyl-tRNA synthetase